MSAYYELIDCYPYGAPESVVLATDDQEAAEGFAKRYLKLNPDIHLPDPKQRKEQRTLTLYKVLILTATEVKQLPDDYLGGERELVKHFGNSRERKHGKH